MARDKVDASASSRISFNWNLDFGLDILNYVTLRNWPRARTWRSIEKQSRGNRIAKKLDLEAGLDKRALYNNGGPVETLTSSSKLRLNKFPQMDE